MVHTGGQWMFRLLALVFLIHTSLCLRASTGQNDQGKQKVSVVADNKELQEVFRVLKQQTGLTFFYSETLINTKERITVHMVNKTLDEVLQKVLGSRGLVWEYADNVVGIKKSEERHKSSRSVEVTGDTSVTSQSISGKVVSADGTAIPGATVMLKGTKQGTTTDSEGKFTLAREAKGDMLIISSVGFEKREIPVKGKTILAQLNVAVNELDETVIVAYGTSTKRSNVGAVTVVKGEAIENMPNRSFDRSLQGQVPGLLVTSGNGQPGGGTSNFVLRGIGTGADANFGSSVRQPLILIDGVPLTRIDLLQKSYTQNAAPVTNSLASFNPADIESITVLKDAAAISLYGSQASNGVLLITTKKGKAGATRFQFHHQTDVASAINKQNKMLNKEEYLTLLKESYKNLDPTLWTDDAIDADLKSKFPTYIDAQGESQFYDQQDWHNALYNKAAVTLTNELSATGGTDKASFYFNIGYTKQNGTIKHTGFDRLSLRYNFSNQAKSWLRFGMNSNISYTDQSYSQSVSSEDITSGQGFAFTIPVLNPVRFKNGEYNLQPFVRPGRYFNNPIAQLEYNIAKTQTYRLLGNLFGEVAFLKNFTFKTNVGADVMSGQIKEKIDPRFSLSASRPPGTGSITDASNFFSRIVNTNTLSYNPQINSQNVISILLGQESQIENNKALSATGEGLNIPYLEDLITAITISDAYGTSMKTSLLSYFGQVNYQHKQTHYLSLSARKDGSSKFGTKNRYGTYWSVGGGWIFKNEPFLKSVLDWLSYGKIRGSIGTSGNSSTIDAVTQFNLLTSGNYNGNPAVTSTPGNPEIAWEKSLNLDLGIELEFAKRIYVTVDLYKRNISELLYAYRLPGTSGSLNVIQNVGKMQNKGIEVSIAADIIKKTDFNWSINANWSSNVNKLIKANEPLAASSTMVNQEGENFNSFYLVRWAGVDPADGKSQWFDKDGKITKTYSEEDKVIVGKPQPDGFGGITSNFRFKAWEFAAFFYYQYGYKIYDGALNSLVNDGASLPYINQSKEALDRWQKPGDNAKNPQRVLNNTDRGSRYGSSDRVLSDGDYVRLKSITLAYKLPNTLSNRWKLASVRAYVQANNLALWTKFKGFDPESLGSAGETNFAYPQSRSFSIGLDLTF